MISNLPNILTLSRIGVIPLLVATFFFAGDWARWTAVGLFAAAGITDFFDGYVARKRNQQSDFGRFLDPVADKLVVAAAILMIVAADRALLLPAVVILCREILVSGLREFLAGLKVGVPVSRLAKWKTTLQMVAIGFLLVGDAAPAGVPAALIGEIGLWAAALVTLYTGYDYLRGGLGHLLGAGIQGAGKPRE